MKAGLPSTVREFHGLDACVCMIVRASKIDFQVLCVCMYVCMWIDAGMRQDTSCHFHPSRLDRNTSFAAFGNRADINRSIHSGERACSAFPSPCGPELPMTVWF